MEEKEQRWKGYENWIATSVFRSKLNICRQIVTAGSFFPYPSILLKSSLYITANAEALKFQAFEKPMELIYICGRKSSSKISCSDFLAAHHVKEGKAYFIKISHQTYANYNRKEIIYIKLKINSNFFFWEHTSILFASQSLTPFKTYTFDASLTD